ncbi:hypothetical protein DY000_02006109 [Brassica cretica]|uniref:Uncharacterized protein n=1 Tax=Brassica cretica TaxID=69181 RepID=A0ABQ7CKR8_BRACR|nr:hypothetical protein DY000_02006109 [Brassica cretica]
MINSEELEANRGEAQKEVIQYTDADDPAERAPRRLRVRQPEAQVNIEILTTRKGSGKKTTTPPSSASQARIPISERLGNISPSSGSQARVPISTRLGLSSPNSGPQTRLPVSARLGPLPEIDIASASRIPIMERLGPLLDEVMETEVADPEGPPIASKRKPGRPPGKRREEAHC